MTISLYHILKGRKHKYLFSMLFLVLLNLQFKAQDTITGTLRITFTDIRSNIGNIVAGIYDNEDQWINEPSRSYSWAKETLVSGSMTVEIPDLPYGTYAISVLDDEDMNEEMKYFMGLPREGWGMSNNPSFRKIKAPSCDKCTFELDSPLLDFDIKINYLRKNKEIKYLPLHP